jgi:hypothetical protein
MLGTDDRAQIAELMARFATGIDTLDWAMYRSVFTDARRVAAGAADLREEHN